MGKTLISYASNNGGNAPYLRHLLLGVLPIVHIHDDWKGAMFNKFSKLAHSVHLALGMLVACIFPLAVCAQDSGVGPEFMTGAQRWLNNAVSSLHQAGASPLRMEVEMGELDSRLRLAACPRVEPYVPVGTRLWGKTRLGLRCLDGVTKWNVFLPVTVRAYGSAWVVKGNVASGAVLTEADAMEAEVDWAEDSSPVVAMPAQWLGQVATRALTTGQALRQIMIKPAQVFQAGTQIRVVAQGPGFQITSDGQALSAGVIGQAARVRMENGRIMSGVVLDNRTVKLEI